MERLKQKVAASSSKVIASLAQAAAATSKFQPDSACRRTSNDQTTTSSSNFAGQDVQDAAANNQDHSSPSELLDAAKHLTAEERKILAQVFKKEQEFERDTRKHLQAASVCGNYKAAQEAPVVGDKNQRRAASAGSGSPAASSPRLGSSASSANTPTTRIITATKSNAAGSQNSGNRRRRPQSSANNDEPECRICRKDIESDEERRECSVCKETVCDDCASYSGQVQMDQSWACSSCRRRLTQASVAPSILRELGIENHTSSSTRQRMRLAQANDSNNISNNNNTASRNKAAPDSQSSSGCSSAQSAAGLQSAQQPRSEQLSTSSPQQQQPRQLAMQGARQQPPQARKMLSSSPPSSAVAVAARHQHSQHQSQHQYQQQTTFQSKQQQQYHSLRRASVSASELQPQPQQQAMLARRLCRKQSASGLSSGSGCSQAASASATITPHASTASILRQQQQQHQFQQQLQQLQMHQISVPGYEQAHVRRLSDQSNLVRRSSISADAVAALGALQRNRSQSNIDSAYLPQCIIGATSSNSALFHGQQHLQQSRPALHQHRHRLASLVTSAAHKRRSSGDVCSASSSSLDDDTQSQLQTVLPAPHFPSTDPFAAAAAVAQQQQQQQRAQSAAGINGPLPIPSVSVSEFRNRCQQSFGGGVGGGGVGGVGASGEQLQSQQKVAGVTTTAARPFQNDVRRYSACADQPLHQQQQESQKQQEQQPTVDGGSLRVIQATSYARRGSGGGGGRILPRVPGEQSLSMLNLAHSSPLGSSVVGTVGGGYHSAGMGGCGYAGDAHQAPDQLGLPAQSPNSIRRASAPEGQNIKIIVDDAGSFECSMSSIAGLGLHHQGNHHHHQFDGGGTVANGGITHSHNNNNNNHHQHHSTRHRQLYERLVLYRDDALADASNQAVGFGLRVVGGLVDPNDGRLVASVACVAPGGPADKVGVKPGDQIVEWDDKRLVGLSFEQVVDVIESSANIAEILVKPAARLELAPGAASYVRSQRRMSLASCGSGGAVQNAARTGTGRRLPAIPTQHQFAASASNLVQQQESGAAGVAMVANYQQQHKVLSNGFQNVPAAQQQPLSEQSRSTNELYAAQQQHQAALAQLQIGQRRLSSSCTGAAETLAALGIGSVGPANATAGSSSSTATTNANASSRHWQQQAGQLPYQPPDFAPLGLDGGSTSRAAGLLLGVDELCGAIGLQVSVDERAAQLEVVVLGATNVPRDYQHSLYFARVTVVPNTDQFKPCDTNPSADMNWMETFIFQNFPTHQVRRMALEISIWALPELSVLQQQQHHNQQQPICEALVSISAACAKGADYWPLRRPLCSPQLRRKSLNDLLANNKQQSDAFFANCSIQQQFAIQPQFQQPLSSASNSLRNSGQQHQINVLFARERSASNRNLPETRAESQPRRASDELFRSKMLTLTPAQSRRAISALNVGGGGGSGGVRGVASGSLTPAQRLMSGGASPVRLLAGQRRNSRQRLPSVGGFEAAGIGIGGVGGGGGAASAVASAIAARPPTPPATATCSATTAVPLTLAQSTQAPVPQPQPPPVQQQQQQPPKPEAPSRRPSSENQSQRKGSFAVATLRKLKRTMSSTKAAGADSVSAGSSSLDAAELDTSAADRDLDSASVASDMGVPQRLLTRREFVGKISMSVMLSESQLELEVLNGQDLEIDSKCPGIYVKMYLRGKTRAHKRKTKVVPPSSNPVFNSRVKYDASLIDNKVLEVSLWYKKSGLKAKICAGYTQIRLDKLKLAQFNKVHNFHLHAGLPSYRSSLDND